MDSKNDYESKKDRLIAEIIKKLEIFEKETKTFLTKIEIKPINILKNPDAFGFPIERRFLNMEIKTTIDTNEIYFVDNILYSSNDK